MPKDELPEGFWDPLSSLNLVSADVMLSDGPDKRPWPPVIQLLHALPKSTECIEFSVVLTRENDPVPHALCQALERLPSLRLVTFTWLNETLYPSNIPFENHITEAKKVLCSLKTCSIIHKIN